MTDRRTKLTDSDIIGIKHLIRTGAKQREIAKQYGVSQGHVSKIAAGLRSNPAEPEPAGLNWPNPDVANVLPSFDEIGKPSLISFDDVEAELDEEQRLLNEENRQLEEMFETMAGDVEQELNDQLLADLFTVDEHAEEEKPLPSSAPRAARMPWHQVRKRQPTHPFVLFTDQLDENEGEIARAILCEIFANVPARHWYNDQVMNAIRERFEEAGVPTTIGDLI